MQQVRLMSSPQFVIIVQPSLKPVLITFVASCK